MHLSIVVTVIVLSVCARSVFPTGVFEIQITDYQLPSCELFCNIYFRFCLSTYQQNDRCSLERCLIGNSSTYEQSVRVLPGATVPFQRWPSEFSLTIGMELEYVNGTRARIECGRFFSNMRPEPRAFPPAWSDVRPYIGERSWFNYRQRVWCDSGYHGTSCDTVLTCRPQSGDSGHYTCNNYTNQMVCLPGWTGDYCQAAICAKGCHRLHGSCELPGECKCADGWTSELCDQCKPSSDCHSQRGMCDNEQPGTCRCRNSSLIQPACSNVNLCKLPGFQACYNGGRCTSKADGSYTCSCLKGYSGRSCRIEVGMCIQQQCVQARGSCDLVNGTYQCVCKTGWSGPTCSADVDECRRQPSPCQHRGSRCVNTPGSFRCDCADGWAGARCTERAQEVPCENSQCVRARRCQLLLGPSASTGAPAAPYVCHCRQGWTGPWCDRSTVAVGKMIECPEHYTGPIQSPMCQACRCLNGSRICYQKSCNCLATAGSTQTLCAVELNDLSGAGGMCQELTRQICLSPPCDLWGTCQQLPENPGCAHTNCTAVVLTLLVEWIPQNTTVFDLCRQLSRLNVFHHDISFRCQLLRTPVSGRVRVLVAMDHAGPTVDSELMRNITPSFTDKEFGYLNTALVDVELYRDVEHLLNQHYHPIPEPAFETLPSMWLVVALAVGSVVLLVFLGIFIFCLCRLCHRRRRDIGSQLPNNYKLRLTNMLHTDQRHNKANNAAAASSLQESPDSGLGSGGGGGSGFPNDATVSTFVDLADSPRRDGCGDGDDGKPLRAERCQHPGGAGSTTANKLTTAAGGVIASASSESYQQSPWRAGLSNLPDICRSDSMNVSALAAVKHLSALRRDQHARNDGGIDVTVGARSVTTPETTRHTRHITLV